MEEIETHKWSISLFLSLFWAQESNYFWLEDANNGQAGQHAIIYASSWMIRSIPKPRKCRTSSTVIKVGPWRFFLVEMLNSSLTLFIVRSTLYLLFASYFFSVLLTCQKWSTVVWWYIVNVTRWVRKMHM